MIVKNVMPTVITEYVVETAKEFEKIGFKQKHHLVEENKIELIVMDTEGGSRVEFMTPPAPGVKHACGNTVIVDNIDEAIDFFSTNGFKKITDVITAQHTKVCIMLWEATGTMTSVMQHVKEE